MSINLESKNKLYCEKQQIQSLQIKLSLCMVNGSSYTARQAVDMRHIELDIRTKYDTKQPTRLDSVSSTTHLESKNNFYCEKQQIQSLQIKLSVCMVNGSSDTVRLAVNMRHIELDIRTKYDTKQPTRLDSVSSTTHSFFPMKGIHLWVDFVSTGMCSSYFVSFIQQVSFEVILLY